MADKYEGPDHYDKFADRKLEDIAGEFEKHRSEVTQLKYITERSGDLNAYNDIVKAHLKKHSFDADGKALKETLTSYKGHKRSKHLAQSLLRALAVHGAKKVYAHGLTDPKAIAEAQDAAERSMKNHERVRDFVDQHIGGKEGSYDALVEQLRNAESLIDAFGYEPQLKSSQEIRKIMSGYADTISTNQFNERRFQRVLLDKNNHLALRNYVNKKLKTHKLKDNVVDQVQTFRILADYAMAGKEYDPKMHKDYLDLLKKAA